MRKLLQAVSITTSLIAGTTTAGLAQTDTCPIISLQADKADAADHGWKVSETPMTDLQAQKAVKYYNDLPGDKIDPDQVDKVYLAEGEGAPFNIFVYVDKNGCVLQRIRASFETTNEVLGRDA